MDKEIKKYYDDAVENGMANHIKNNSIINSLKRLERAGAENSRTTEKLKEACEEVASKIKGSANFDFDMDDIYQSGYDLCKITDRIENNLLVVKTSNEFFLTYEDEWKPTRIDCMKTITRARALRFSRDISEGLLNEISDFLEKRTKRSEEAIENLENAEI